MTGNFKILAKALFPGLNQMFRLEAPVWLEINLHYIRQFTFTKSVTDNTQVLSTIWNCD